MRISDWSSDVCSSDLYFYFFSKGRTMWPYPKMIAHRGGGNQAPENTLAAMRCGLEHGFAGVEFDVMLAQDGVPIVMHDPQLGRTVAGSGSVADYPSAELMRMDAGAWFDARYAGEKVPSLEQEIGRAS